MAASAPPGASRADRRGGARRARRAGRHPRARRRPSPPRRGRGHRRAHPSTAGRPSPTPPVWCAPSCSSASAMRPELASTVVASVPRKTSATRFLVAGLPCPAGRPDCADCPCRRGLPRTGSRVPLFQPHAGPENHRGQLPDRRRLLHVPRALRLPGRRRDAGRAGLSRPGKSSSTRPSRKMSRPIASAVTITHAGRGSGPFTLIATSQGCADAGLCYAPMESQARLSPARWRRC